MNNQDLQVIQALQADYGTARWNRWNPFYQPYYDYVDYDPGGPAEMDFFSVPLGAPDPIGGVRKTLEDTNVKVARQLGQNYQDVWAVRMDFRWKPKARQPTAIATDANLLYRSLSDVQNELVTLLKTGVLTLTIDNRQWLQVERPLEYAPAGFGIDLTHHASAGSGGESPDASEVWWVQPNSDGANIFELSPARIWIAPSTVIQATLSFPSGNAPALTNLVDGATPRCQIGLYLDGFSVKAAQ